MPSENSVVIDIATKVRDVCPQARFAYLFGSQADGTASENSDYDVAVFTATPCAPIERWNMAEQLAHQLGRDVDWIDLRQCSSVLQYQIISTGHLLFDSPPMAAHFETTVASMYTHLQEERQSILDDWQQRLTGAPDQSAVLATDISKGQSVDDFLLSKAATIKRCLERIRKVYGENAEHFTTDITRQDSVILNLQRGCEAALDMANRCIRLHRLGVPQSSRDAFQLLLKAGWINDELNRNLQAMIGLRNIAVHDYQTLNLDIVIHVIDHRLDDLALFAQQLIQKQGVK